MSNSIQILAGSAAKVPRQPYICRFVKGVKGKSAAQNEMITATGEILSPDLVPNPDNADQQIRVAGQKFNSYFIVDPSNERGYTSSVAAFGRLQLLNEDGEFNTDNILAAMNSGGLCFVLPIEGEEDFHRYAKKPGEKQGLIMTHPQTGKPMSRGYRLTTPFPDDYVDRVPTLDGLPAVPEV